MPQHLIRTSLFDRLMDDFPEAKNEFATLNAYDESRYKASVLRDISCLFNTRSSRPVQSYKSEPLTVLDYGIPDLAHYSLASTDDQQHLALLFRRAIQAFEPRLCNPVIVVNSSPLNEKRLEIHIQGRLIHEKGELYMTFVTSRQTGYDSWAIHELEG